LIAWTAAAIVVGIVARFTFAAPEPPCPRPDEGLCFEFHFEVAYYYLIVFVWLLGLLVICITSWFFGARVRLRRESPATAEGRSEDNAR